ncbi:spermatogenesis-associated protein 6-like isoform X1 [Mya arenaria]|uniref:spermatogenesis-associated protein 6-like isoform X1 n=1 Tax=Mya arenaria TaxID=6604 RepID=UPI0022E27AAF|nr:spermatogenesis-associated protein 6-like isoform X1 [Mya arenaria]
MPRRALRCVVDLNIQRVSAPGVWLPSREDCYISISLFGQYRNTRNVLSVFPIILHEPFRFEKTYYTALDPQDVAEFLEDELVVVELLQYSDYSNGAIRLASFSTSAREFLFPYPSLCPSYTSDSREILLSRTIAWPGISPKLEFTTKTVIKESRSPELDALEDALEEERLARRARSRSRGRSLTRSRSLSRTRACSADDLCITITRSYSSDSEDEAEYDSEPSYMRPTVSSIFRSRSKSGVRSSDESMSEETGKAPFVVRHLETSLIGRTPGAPALKGGKGKKRRSRSRSRSRPTSALSGYASYEPKAQLGSAKCPRCSKTTCVYMSGVDCLVCRAYRRYFGHAYWGHSPNFHPTGMPCCDLRKKKVLRDGADSLPVYSTKIYSDDDEEVAALTSSRSYLSTPRPRSVSPYLYRPTYSARFGGLSAVDKLEIELAVERARSRARARAIALSRSPSPIRYSPILRKSMDDLALDTSIARNRRYYPRYLI